MNEPISTGTIFVEDGTLTPEPLAFTTARRLPGWSAVTESTSAQLGTDLESAGWTFFFMAGEVHANGFGLDAKSRMDRALAHVIDTVSLEHCNCLEITEVKLRTILGIPYTRLGARARHIQKSRSFQTIFVKSLPV
jgi:hypothetical protein